jgi:hypothetical protein
MTRGSARTTSAGPSAMTWPNSSTTTRSQMPSTSPMSCSISSIDCPWSARARRQAPSSPLSRVSRPAAGSSRHSSRGLAASARATPTSLRWPMDSWAGLASAAQSRPTRASACSADPSRAASSRAATVRFSRTSRSSNSSVLCHVRASPRRARSYGSSPPRSVPPSSTRPVLATKPEAASTSVVLPAPLGPIRPTSSPSRTSSVTSRSACTPPNATDRPATRNTTGRLASSVRSARWVPGAGGRCGSAPPAAAVTSGACRMGRLCVRR